MRGDDAEVQALYQDLLIRVTQFFRDAEAFEALKEQVFPAIVDGRSLASAVRIWVAGCSTGEEVYSLAISVLEYLEGRAADVGIKILATDLNENALEKARAGVYLDNIEIDVSPPRLRRFFVRHNGHYQISKAVRELCVFSRHNIISDAPFSRLDLVSCRNMLIYMDVALQKKVIRLLHYSLNPKGFLFLGSSENIAGFSELFETVDGRNRIFVRAGTSSGMPIDFGPAAGARRLLASAEQEDRALCGTHSTFKRKPTGFCYRAYAPVGVVVDETMTVLQFRGRTAAFLEPAPGMASLDLFRMLREGLLAEVRAATLQAKTENVPVSRGELRISDGGNGAQVRVDVIPFKVPPSGIRLLPGLVPGIEPPTARHRRRNRNRSCGLALPTNRCLSSSLS